MPGNDKLNAQSFMFICSVDCLQLGAGVCSCLYFIFSSAHVKVLSPRRTSRGSAEEFDIILLINHALPPPHQAKLAHETSQRALQHANMETSEKRVGRISELAFCDSSRAVLLLFTLLASQSASFSGDMGLYVTQQSVPSIPTAGALLGIAHRQRTPCTDSPPGSALGVAWAHPRTIPCTTIACLVLSQEDILVIKCAHKISRETILGNG